MKLASMEYLEEIKKRSNADAEYLELAKGHNASYTLVLEPEPDEGVSEQFIIKVLQCIDRLFLRGVFYKSVFLQLSMVDLYWPHECHTINIEKTVR